MHTILSADKYVHSFSVRALLSLTTASVMENGYLYKCYFWSIINPSLLKFMLMYALVMFVSHKTAIMFVCADETEILIAQVFMHPFRYLQVVKFNRRRG